MVLCRPHRWHVQELGCGPLVLLIHGAGGATQSWRGILPRLSGDFRLVAVDLPGQGFTQLGARGRCGLEPMAQDLGALMAAEGWRPDAVVGHSAGAAIALRLAAMEVLAPGARVVGLNAALGTFKGVAGWLFPLMAKVLSAAPFTADIFTATVSEPGVRQLLRGTGSRPDAEMVRLYLRLARDRAHVDATLAMMAQWDLTALLAELPRLAHRVDLVATEGDLAVPARTSREAAGRMRDARVHLLPDLGHLAHEEAPEPMADLIRTLLT